MRKTGILTYEAKYQTNCLEFNPFKPNVKPEKIFESIELSLNSPGYIPFLSKISGKGRIMFALAQIIFGISYAIFDAMHISGGNLTPRDGTSHILSKIRKGRLTLEKIFSFFPILPTYSNLHRTTTRMSETMSTTIIKIDM